MLKVGLFLTPWAAIVGTVDPTPKWFDEVFEDSVHLYSSPKRDYLFGFNCWNSSKPPGARRNAG